MGVEVFESALPKGTTLEWHFTSDSSGRIWVDKIDVPEISSMKSFGVQSQIYDFGVLDLKPLDYSKQVEGIPNSYRTDFNDHPDYEDITPFIAQLEPVRLHRDYSSHR